jgi:hypothetical protein
MGSALQERNSALAGGLERTSLHSFFRNIKYSWRMLRRNPGLTTAVVATLALGIGATTAIYTVIYATLLSPLPLPHPEQLVMVWSKVQGNRNGIAAGDFLDWQRYSSSFQKLCAFTGGNFNLGTKDKPEQVEGRLASPGRIGHFLDRIVSLQGLAEEETQGCGMRANRSRALLPFVQQIELILPDLVWPELIRWSMEVLCKIRNCLEISRYGSL